MMFNEPKWIEIKVKGEHSGQEYFGMFQVKPFLQHDERADAVRLAESYAYGINRTEDQRLFLTTLAFLKFHVVATKNVDWWDDGSGLKLVDEEPVFELGRALNKIQDAIRGPKPEKEEGKQVDE